MQRNKRAAEGEEEEEGGSRKKKRRLSKEQEEEAEGSSGLAKWLKGAEEATVGAHALATAVALGEHGQILCRLDPKGSLIGRIHLTELSEPGQQALIRKAVPGEPLHVVVLGAREDTTTHEKAASGKSPFLVKPQVW